MFMSLNKRMIFTSRLKLQHVAAMIGILVVGYFIFRDLAGPQALCAFVFTTLLSHTVLADKVYHPNLSRIDVLYPLIVLWMAHILLFLGLFAWVALTI